MNQVIKFIDGDVHVLLIIIKITFQIPLESFVG